MTSLLQNSLTDFLSFLKKENIRRFYFVFDPHTKKIKTSHAAFQEIATQMELGDRDFNEHEGLFFEVSQATEALHGVFLHWTNRGQGQGGVRFWTYETFEDYFRDGLRLSEGMTRKNALASLWWGGGKGIIARPQGSAQPEPSLRKKLFEEYGTLLTALKGCYVTAEDVGASPQDLEVVHSKTRFVSCIPPEIGGSGNPSLKTAQGVLRAIEGALEFSGKGTIEGKTIAVQGLGNVATFLIDSLYERGAKKIIASDIFESRIQNAKERYSKRDLKTTLADRNDPSILYSECDVLAPCATGAILNSRTIPRIKAKIICGAANNQLEDPKRDDQALLERDILYVPDFVANRMGIVNCANEQYGYVEPDPVTEQHLSRDWKHSVFQVTQRVLKESRDKKRPTAQIAIELADKRAREDHPLFGHRSQKIIQAIAASHWSSTSPSSLKTLSLL